MISIIVTQISIHVSFVIPQTATKWRKKQNMFFVGSHASTSTRSDHRNLFFFCIRRLSDRNLFCVCPEIPMLYREIHLQIMIYNIYISECEAVRLHLFPSGCSKKPVIAQLVLAVDSLLLSLIMLSYIIFCMFALYIFDIWYVYGSHMDEPLNK